MALAWNKYGRRAKGADFETEKFLAFDEMIPLPLWAVPDGPKSPVFRLSNPLTGTSWIFLLPI